MRIASRVLDRSARLSLEISSRIEDQRWLTERRRSIHAHATILRKISRLFYISHTFQIKSKSIDRFTRIFEKLFPPIIEIILRTVVDGTQRNFYLSFATLGNCSMTKDCDGFNRYISTGSRKKLPNATVYIFLLRWKMKHFKVSFVNEKAYTVETAPCQSFQREKRGEERFSRETETKKRMSGEWVVNERLWRYVTTVRTIVRSSPVVSSFATTNLTEFFVRARATSLRSMANF